MEWKKTKVMKSYLRAVNPFYFSFGNLLIVCLLKKDYSFLFFNIFTCICLSLLVCPCTECVQALCWLEEDDGSSRTGVTDPCEPP